MRFLRPPETEFARFRLGITVEHVCEYVDGWDGVSEATLLGASVGASDPLPFTPELWAAAVRDRMDWVPPVARAIAQSITDHLAAKETASGN